MEAEVTQVLVESIATIATISLGVATPYIAPVIAAFGAIGYLFGRKYERKWNKKNGQYQPTPEPTFYEPSQEE